MVNSEYTKSAYRAYICASRRECVDCAKIFRAGSKENMNMVCCEGMFGSNNTKGIPFII